GNDVLAHLASQHRHFDELIILEAVANDGRIAAVGEGQDSQQLWLGAGLKANVVALADVENLLHDVTLLVDLDGVDAPVVAAVVEFRDRAAEGVVDLTDAMSQDVGETEQDGQLDAALLQLIHQLLQIDAALLTLVGVDRDVALLIDVEVALAP